MIKLLNKSHYIKYLANLINENIPRETTIAHRMAATNFHPNKSTENVFRIGESLVINGYQYNTANNIHKFQRSIAIMRAAAATVIYILHWI